MIIIVTKKFDCSKKIQEMKVKRTWKSYEDRKRHILVIWYYISLFKKHEPTIERRRTRSLWKNDEQNEFDIRKKIWKLDKNSLS